MKALVGTRKGLIMLKHQGKAWHWQNISFAGVSATLAGYDPLNRCIWAGINHGHWGCKLHVSFDEGETYKELAPPKFPSDTEVSLKAIWGMGFDESGRVYLGTEPAALFYSDDCGETWTLNESFYQIHGKEHWFGGGSDAPCLHSILIHPNDRNKLLVGISVAGILRSDDRGETWRYSNKGQKANYLPDPDAEVGQDPHLVVADPKQPDVLWQQNHCGLYRSNNFGATWQDFSEAAGLKSSFGWAVAVADDGSIYTVPAKSDECRIAVDDSLFVQVSRNEGSQWRELRAGLPASHSYDICYRHALDTAGENVMFGTTNGNLYWSDDSGESWNLFSGNLPPIYSIALME